MTGRAVSRDHHSILNSLVSSLFSRMFYPLSSHKKEPSLCQKASAMECAWAAPLAGGISVMRLTTSPSGEVALDFNSRCGMHQGP